MSYPEQVTKRVGYVYFFCERCKSKSSVSHSELNGEICGHLCTCSFQFVVTSRGSCGEVLVILHEVKCTYFNFAKPVSGSQYTKRSL